MSSHIKSCDFSVNRGKLGLPLIFGPFPILLNYFYLQVDPSFIEVEDKERKMGGLGVGSEKGWNKDVAAMLSAVLSPPVAGGLYMVQYTWYTEHGTR